MLLVFGGTTEGKQVAKTLDEQGFEYFYSTKTKVAFTGKGKAIYGALTTLDIECFCKKHTITHIINASHPFAEVLHKTISSINLDLPLIRFKRQFPPHTQHPLIQYSSNFDEAIQHFKKQKYDSLLALSGVQTITKLKPYWIKNKTWFRILDKPLSRKIAEKEQFPSEHLLFGFPQNTPEEIKLFKTINPSVILTKESGTNGKLEAKIEAAIATQIPLLILKKPLLSKRYICVDTITHLLTLISE